MTLNPTAARERLIGRRHVERLLDDLCLDFRLDPWQVWRSPSLHARADAVLAMSADIRAGALAAQGIRPRGRDGRFVAVGK